MGKPFLSELEYLSTAYDWALQESIEPLAQVIHRFSAHNLIAIGSGGSYTSASFHAFLHETLTDKLSYATTPYQALNKPSAIKVAAVSLITAEGKNNDVMGCFRFLSQCEPTDLLTIALKGDSPVQMLAKQTKFASSASFSMPWGKDGYLATNSLFATCVLLYRAYQFHFKHRLPELPKSFDALTSTCIELSDISLDIFLKQLAPNRNRPFLVITGLAGQIAGIDLESKISESALGTVQVADFRSFAHGRHIWSETNQSNAAAIVLWSDEEQALFDNLVNTLPPALPVLSVKLKGDRFIQQIASLVTVFNLIGRIGKLCGIDPGEPEVNQAGRNIYAFDAFSGTEMQNSLSDQDIALHRKYGGLHLHNPTYEKDFKKEYQNFIRRLTSASFDSIVFDYDATLCTPDHRFDPLDPVVASALNNLLEHGIKIGIATGRGQSVRNELLQGISEKYHHRVVVGYYNGGLIQSLSDQIAVSHCAGPALKGFYELMLSDSFFVAVFAKIEPRPSQLTFTVRNVTHCELAWRAINEVLGRDEFTGLKALRSTHSWDVVETNTSKVNVIPHVASAGYETLTIGDKGLWPGNDCELLNTGYGLSVDEVSPLSNHGWKISPIGTKGVGATLYYLGRIRFSESSFSYHAEP